MTADTQKKPEWSTAYEAGYQVGYRHGLHDARRALHGPDGPQATPDETSVDVSGNIVQLSPAGRSGSRRR